jgi:Uma2 family endonuclease
MTTAAAKTVWTPEDLLALPDSVNYELVDGALVERHMGSESSAIALAIGVALANYIRAKKLGHLFTTDCGYQCFPADTGRVRKPDVSFIRVGRLPGERLPKGHVKIPPDLAVEVLSRNDLADEVEEKVQEYLSVGVPLVWVVSPTTRTIRIHRQPNAALGPISALTEADKISREDVIAGFECSVKEFFDV